MALRGLTRVQKGILRELTLAWQRSPVAVLMCARRLGKSHLDCAYLDEVCITGAGSMCVYAAATESGLRDFSGPIMDTVLAARGGERPEWRSSESMWVYENGSRILLVGCDERRKVDRHRGQAAHVVVVDEAAIIRELRYVIGSVFAPMLLTTGGRMLVSSSGPFTTSDDFAGIVAEARAGGTLVVRTIDDADHVSAEAVEQYARSVGGRRSATFRREMLCEIAVDASTAVIPEWQDAAPDIVGEADVSPPWAIKHTVLDGGFVDMMVAAFGYVWWESGRFVVTDEVVCQRATSPEIAQAVLDMERIIDARPGTPKGKRTRSGDLTPQSVADLRAAGLDVYPLVKGDVLASTARLRSAVQERRLVVSPTCKTIIAHAESAQWAPSGRDMRRVLATETAPGHHYDGCAALRYFVDVAERDARTDPRPLPTTLARQLGYDSSARDTRADVLSSLRRSQRGAEERRKWIDKR